MKFIDSHTHLFDKAFDNDKETVVNNAIVNNVTQMVLPCCNENSLIGIEELCSKFPQNCYATIGLHPEDINNNPEKQLDTIFNHSIAQKAVAIGEIGIDLHWRNDNKDLQFEIFDYQLQKAIELNLPVIIHCRDAYNETLNFMEKYKGKLRGVFHCFGGDENDVAKINSLGEFYFGIGGVVTFKTSGIALATLVANTIKLSQIVLETDSPYLTPAPYRGKRNDSSMIPIIAQKIAEIKNIDITEVANVTTKNAKKLFKI